MRDGWRALIRAINEASDAALERPAQWWTYGQDRPPTYGAQIITSVLNEVSHHGTQICLLRDLYYVATHRG
jgi:hypothetical protein